MANVMGIHLRPGTETECPYTALGAVICDKCGWVNPVLVQREKDRMKVAVCEYLLEVNRGFVTENGHPLIAPTAIDWLGDGIVEAITLARQATPVSDQTQGQS